MFRWAPPERRDGANLLTTPIVLTLSILLGAVVLFITERIRVDLVALLVLGSLAITGLVSPAEAVSGFSNPAVITVWAVFILSGGLSRTGVANIVGRQVLRLGGKGEARLLVVIMLTAAVMSAFMNNVGVAALLLPVVMNISRRTGHARSRLLMPLAFGSLLGGLSTLIGTPPNILASNALVEFDLPAFGLFDFAPVGVVATLAGIAYMVLIGRRLLPSRDPSQPYHRQRGETLGQMYELRELICAVHLAPDSELVGKTLAASRLGSALSLSVFGIIRNGQSRLAPPADMTLQAGDQLLIVGKLDRLREIGSWQHLEIETGNVSVGDLASEEVVIAEVRLAENSQLVGESLQQTSFRRQFKANVLAIWRDQAPLRTNIQNIAFNLGDSLLIQARQDQIDLIRESPDFDVSETSHLQDYRLEERLLTITIPEASSLVGGTLAESRLGDAFDLNVLGIRRGASSHLIPEPDTLLEAGDQLLVIGRKENVRLLQSLQDLQFDYDSLPDFKELENEEVALIEAVLSPHTTLVGKSLRELHFREKYGLSVLALWREGQAFHTNLRDIPLKFGDALLLYGPRERINVLGSEPDFLLLAEEAQETPRLGKAPLAGLIMLGVVVPVLFGVIPISIAAVVGATLMVLTGCLTMDEAYRYIEWQAVFLIAGMLPLGIAMEQTGAARLVAEAMVTAVGGLGALPLIAGLFVLTSVASQVMPNPVVTVLMAPIAINSALDLDLSARALMMVVALSASASFLSPVGHPANVLIMGPGGYRFTDYVKVGFPLTVVILIIALTVLPVFWPL